MHKDTVMKTIKIIFFDAFQLCFFSLLNTKLEIMQLEPQHLACIYNLGEVPITVLCVCRRILFMSRL